MTRVIFILSFSLSLNFKGLRCQIAKPRRCRFKLGDLTTPGCYTTIFDFFSLFFPLFVAFNSSAYCLSNNLRSDILEICLEIFRPNSLAFLCPHYTISFGFLLLSRPADQAPGRSVPSFEDLIVKTPCVRQMHCGAGLAFLLSF